MAAKKELTGFRSGKLVAIRRDGRSVCGRIVWLCQCDCGNKTRVEVSNLSAPSSKNTQSCGCYRTSLHLLPGDVGSFNQMFDRYRACSRTRKIEFLLTKKEFRHITKQVCNYCGADPVPSYARNRKIANVVPYICNGIDRVDNMKGYTVDNCVPCCSLCNYMKRGLSFSDFLNHIQKISSFPKVV
jgi:hypothetical protein